MSPDTFELLRLLQSFVPRRLRKGCIAEAPFLGYLDRPFFRGDVLCVRGWIVARARPILELTLVAGGERVPVEYRLPRADVAQSLPREPGARMSGLAIDCRLPHAVDAVEIRARLSDGAEVRVFEVAGPFVVREAAPVVEAPITTPITTPVVEAMVAPVIAPLPPETFPPGVESLLEILAPRTVVELDAPVRDGAWARLARAIPGAAYYPVAHGLGPPGDDPRVCAIDSAPDGARAHFTDGTIDLLIARRGVPPEWLDKLSRRAVVVSAVAPDSARLPPLDGAEGWFTAADAPIRALGSLSTSGLSFAAPESPEVSIIIPVYGGLALTLGCLRSLVEHAGRVSFEVIVVDDASPDSPAAILGGIPGLRLSRRPQNGGFIAACNDGAAEARGRYLLFLNNDTVVTAGWLDALRRTFDDHPAAGLVGAKLILADGTLQEAGSLIFRDGSAMNWGRGDDPDKPEYNCVRDTDYCSGACILLPAELFRRLGGFDVYYSPAYYEDGDLAFRVRQEGLRVLYQPLARVHHLEGGTAGTDLERGMKRHQALNQEKFRRRWQHVLGTYPARPTDERNTDPDRHGGKRVLVIDHVTPRVDLDSGSVRMFEILRLLAQEGLQVTFAAANLERISPHTERLQRLGVEVIYAPGEPSIEAHLERRGARYSAVILSKRDPAAAHLRSVRRLAPHARLVFDTVDLHFVRELREAQLAGDPAALALAERRRAEELALMAESDLTLVVSAVEKQLLSREHAVREVLVLGNIHTVVDAAPRHDGRRDLLFVGFFLHRPNVDAALWFGREIWPLVRRAVPDARLRLVGRDPPPEVMALAGDSLSVTGWVPELRPLIDAARVAIAPLRYGAGVKGKITQSLSCGLPVVATSIAVEGMELDDGQNVLIADDPARFAEQIARLYHDDALWTRLSDNGLQHARAELSVQAAERRLAELLERIGLRDNARRATR